MIAALVEAALARLRDELAPLLESPEAQVRAGPAAPPGEGDALPRLVLWPGRFTVRQTLREERAGEPRPRPARQRFDVEAAAPGPYALDAVPLAGTVSARLLLAEGTAAERRETLAEGRDWALDPATGALRLRADVPARAAALAGEVAAQVHAAAGRVFNLDSPAELSRVLFGELGLPPQGPRLASGYYSTSRTALEAVAHLHPVVPLVLAYRALGGSAPPAALLVEYSYPGVFTVREFEQALRLEVHAADAARAELWASLALAALLTHHDELLAAGGAEHREARTVTAAHQLLGMEAREGGPEAWEGGTRLGMTLAVTGRLTLGRRVGDGVGRIERIFSPGSTEPGAVSIRAGLG